MKAGREELEKLKQLLGIKDTDHDVQVEFALKNAAEAIRNYCHIDEVPEGLSTTLLRMAMDIYRIEQPGDAAVPMAVKSITTGDTSTSFGSLEPSGYPETVLKDYCKQLNRYRKVVF